LEFLALETTTTLDSESAPELKMWVNPHHLDIKNPCRNYRWPTPPNLRAAVMQSALEQCGLDTDGNPLKLPDGSLAPKLSSRRRIAAMRVLAGFERNQIDAQKLDLLSQFEDHDATKAGDEFHKSLLTPELIAEAHTIIDENLNPPITTVEERIKKADRDGDAILLKSIWPLSRAARVGVMTSVVEMCGFSVGSDGEVAPLEIANQPSSRTKAAAMKLLAMFERISLQQVRIDHNVKAYKIKHPDTEYPDVTNEGQMKLHALLEPECIRKYGVKLPVPVFN
jgi:hypothetical protein